MSIGTFWAGSTRASSIRRISIILVVVDVIFSVVCLTLFIIGTVVIDPAEVTLTAGAVLILAAVLNRRSSVLQRLVFTARAEQKLSSS